MLSPDRVEYVEGCKEKVAEVLKPGQNIVKYIRKNNGTMTGVMVAYRGTNNQVHIGWSMCNTKVDKFSRHIGLLKAITRSVNVHTEFGQEWLHAIPNSLLKPMIEFSKRAEKFFK